MNFKTKINRIRMIIFFILCALTIDIILPISVSASESQPIMGEAIANREEMIEYYRENAPTSYPQEYLAQDIELDKLVEVIIHEAETEGVRADVAFVQILLETNWLKFDRGINIRQNNFGGLKDQDENYLSFDSIDEGIRANIQLLKGYASSEPLNQQKVTSLYGLISPKGNIVNVDSLGNGNWSQDSEYGENIKQYLDEIINIKSIHNQENESEPPQPKLEDQTEAIDIKKETIQDAAGKTIEPKTENDLLHQEELRTSKANLTAKLEEFTIDGSGHVGGSHKLEALGSSPNGVEYQFWIKDLSTNKWTMIQDYGTKATATWTPIKSGNYWYGVHIRDSSKNVYRDAHLYKNITIKGVTAKLEEFAIDGPGHVGGSHKLEALGSSPNGVEYQFWIKDLSTNKWRMIQDYGAKDTATWTPKKSGNYWYGVHIRDKYNNVYRDAHLYKNITIKGVTAKLEGFAIDGPGHVGGSHKLEALGSSPNGVEYQFWIKDLSTDKWTMIQDYGTKDIATWTPKKSGNYWYGVHIRDKYNNVYRDAHLYKNITIKGVTAKLEDFTIEGSKKTGEAHILQASGRSTNGVEYQFWIKDLSTNKWTMIQDYGTKDTATWTPKKSGNYWYGVHIRDKYNNVYRDAHLYKNIKITGTQITRTIMLDPGHGGTDPGAHYDGISERNLNLIIANKVANQLRSQGYNVVMSRTTNNSPNNNDLYNRAATANAVGADIYVSIHHNAMPSSSSVSGIETYYYVSKSQYPPLPGNAGSHNDPTRLSNSLTLANSIQNELIKSTGANNRGIKRGSFVVLRETQMPAVLLELGFMTNPIELNRIKSDSYQNTLTSAIVRGINDYFEK